MEDIQTPQKDAPIWFSTLEQSKKDAMVLFVTEAMANYQDQDFTAAEAKLAEVKKDLIQEFKIEDHQAEEFFKFAYNQTNYATTINESQNSPLLRSSRGQHNGVNYFPILLNYRTIRNKLVDFMEVEDYENIQTILQSQENVNNMNEFTHIIPFNDSLEKRHGILIWENNRQHHKIITREFGHLLEVTYDQMEKLENGKTRGQLKISSADLDRMTDGDVIMDDKNYNDKNIIAMQVVGVKKIIANFLAIAVVTDSEVKIFGVQEIMDDFNVSETSLEMKVKDVVANLGAFAFLLDDGTVQCYGSSLTGGTFPHGSITNFAKIYATEQAFAGLTEDGDVYTWGNENEGGAGPPLSNVEYIGSTQRAFGALTKDNRIIVWGDKNYGGAGIEARNAEYQPDFLTPVIITNSETANWSDELAWKWMNKWEVYFA